MTITAQWKRIKEVMEAVENSVEAMQIMPLASVELVTRAVGMTTAGYQALVAMLAHSPKVQVVGPNVVPRPRIIDVITN
jgi:hypothetical protein